MEQDFEALMAAKSEEDLQEYITNSIRYDQETVEAATTELKKRGRIFSDTELTALYQGWGQKKAVETTGKKGYWSGNVVIDPAAPALYSERAIWIFTILFSSIAGSIMMAVNLNKRGKKSASFLTALFGFVYTAIFFCLVQYFIPEGRSTSGLNFIIGAGAALVLNKLIWPKYIGANTKYRARPIWVPLTICLAICTLAVLLVIMGQQ